MNAGWRHDLKANAARSGLKGAMIAWFKNPGFAVVTLARVMQWGDARGSIFGKFVASLFWWHIVRRYGCYISPSSRFGSSVRLPHPVGIVIGDGVRLGDDVTLYQHVTLGRRSAKVDGYPAVGDGVTVYAGAILIGAIAIGDAAVIGAHAIVDRDVARGEVVRTRMADA